MTPAFHFQILDNFFETFNKNSNILCQLLSRSLTKSGNLNGNEIEIFPFIKRCTLDIICGKGFLYYFRDFLTVAFSRIHLTEAAMGIPVNAQLEDSTYIKSIQE